MKLVTNEVEVLKAILMEQYINLKNPMDSARIFIKYLWGLGKSKEEAKVYIVRYLSDDTYKLNVVKYEKRIEDVISYVYMKKYELVYVESVNVTIGELEKICELNDEKREKVAFSYLIHSKVYNKINNSDGNWVYSPTEDIIKESECNKPVQKRKIKGSLIKKKFAKEDYRIVISDLIRLKYIDMSLTTGKNTYKKINFADENSEVVIVVDDFDNYINYYLKWRFGVVDRCGGCGSWIDIAANCIKYCNSCKKEIHKKQDREYQKKKYNSRLNKNIE